MANAELIAEVYELESELIGSYSHLIRPEMNKKFESEVEKYIFGKLVKNCLESPILVFSNLAH